MYKDIDKLTIGLSDLAARAGYVLYEGALYNIDRGLLHISRDA
jgi:hypothetical protein